MFATEEGMERVDERTQSVTTLSVAGKAVG
jgi:hypothetical protein